MPEKVCDSGRVSRLEPLWSRLRVVKEKLEAAKYIVSMLYRNEFTRGIGRDVLMFGASVVLIRIVLVGIVEAAEEGPAAVI